MQVSTPRSRTAGRWLRQGGGVAAVLCGGALLLGACGGSGSPSTNSSVTTPTLPGGSTTPTTPGGSTTPTSSTPSGSSASAIATALQNGENATYDATYTITAGGATTFEYAVDGSKYAATVTNSSGKQDIIYDGTNLFVCKLSSPASCTELPAADAQAYSGAFSLYTGKFWYQDVTALQAYNGVAGFHETTSTMSTAGQTLNCVTWSGGAGSTATGEVCVTSQGALGYAKAVSGGKTTTLTLTSYSTSVPSSAFAPPSGVPTSTIPAGIP